jgi:hypothetical protein
MLIILVFAMVRDSCDLGVVNTHTYITVGVSGRKEKLSHPPRFWSTLEGRFSGERVTEPAPFLRAIFATFDEFLDVFDFCRQPVRGVLLRLISVAQQHPL